MVGGGGTSMVPVPVCGMITFSFESDVCVLVGEFEPASQLPAPPPVPLPAVWDWSGFYIGVGGSFNWTHFDQSLQGVSGTINFVDSSTGELVAQGQEGGPWP